MPIPAGTNPTLGPIIDTSGALLSATTALRDAGAVSLRGGRLQKVNAAGDGWEEVPGHAVSASEPSAGLFEGLLWYDTANEVLRVYDGSAFAAVGGSDGIVIAAYDSTATYSRGSANSIVTHASGLFIYISSTERSSGHDPDTQPGYWLDLSEGVTYMVISSGSHRIAARTLVVDGATDQVYLCTTTQTTPRDLTYIKTQADTIGGTFIELTAMIATTWKGPHITGTTYEAGDRVTTNANSRIYTARVDTSEDPPHADWIQTGPAGSGGGALTDLTDTPSALGSSGQILQVNSAEDALEFVAAPSGSGITQTAADARYALESNNLSDLDNAATARTNLGLGSAAEQESSAFLSQDGGDSRYLNEASNLSDLPNAGTARTNLELGTAATRDTGTAENNVPILDASGDVDATVVPIDNTLQVDGSGDLGVNTQRVIQTVSEWVQHFASGSAHDTSGHSGKYQEYTSSNTVRRIGSVQYDFTPGNSGGSRRFQVFIVELTGRNIDVILGSSEVYSGNNLQHRFHFEDGVTINPNVRIGIGLHRTDGGNNEALSVRSGTESQDSPRESYDDASEDFNFVGRFNHDRPTPSVSDTVGGTTANEIYGNPEIFYQIIHTHASLVGDGNISSSHIDSGSATADQPLLADGSGGTGFRDPVIHGGNLVDNTIPTAKYGNDSVTKSKIGANAKITANPSGTDGDDLERIDIGGTNYNVPGHDGAVTHIESGATYNNNVITVATDGAVRSGDGILFAVPTPFGSSATQAVSLAIDGQANSEHPLHDRNGDALHEADLTANSIYIAISDADSWDILVLPAGTGSGASLSDTTPSAHGIGQSGSAGTATTASRSDHVHAIPVGVPVGIGTANAEGTGTTAARSDHVHAGVASVAVEGAGLSVDQSQGAVTIAASGSWGFQLDTVIVPELNQDAITDARIVLEDSGLTHYLDFLDWTTANLDMISHLPVGAHIGLRQGTTTRILEVEAEWDATNSRYQVTNVNTGILTESASGTATELLLTAGAGGGTTVEANPTGSDGDDLTRIAIDGTNYNVPESGEVVTGFTELRAPATLSVAQTWTATGAIIPAADGDEWVRFNGQFDGEVPENFEFLASRLRVLEPHEVGGSTTTGEVERLQFHDGSIFQRIFLTRTSGNEIILRHESSTQELENLSIYSYSSIAGDGVLTLTPLTDAAHNYSFGTGTIQSGQNNDLFDTNITLPTDLAGDEAFGIRIESSVGETMIWMTKDHLEELATAAPVTWSTSATGVTVVRTGANRNALYHPVGQNRGFSIGRSNEDPQRLLWAISNTGSLSFTMQIVRMTTGGGGGSLPGSEQEDTSVAPGTAFDETSIDVPTGTWGFVNFGDIGMHRLGEWHRFLVADLTELDDGTDTGPISDANALTFLANEESYFQIGKTSGGKVLVGASRQSIQPGTVRIRSN